VTLVSPLDLRVLLTKRIIALPGRAARPLVPYRIPPGHVWLEGDAAVDIMPRSLQPGDAGETQPGPRPRRPGASHARKSRQGAPARLACQPLVILGLNIKSLDTVVIQVTWQPMLAFYWRKFVCLRVHIS
jgi:hypothetical protein